MINNTTIRECFLYPGTGQNVYQGNRGGYDVLLTGTSVKIRNFPRIKKQYKKQRSENVQKRTLKMGHLTPTAAHFLNHEPYRIETEGLE